MKNESQHKKQKALKRKHNRLVFWGRLLAVLFRFFILIGLIGIIWVVIVLVIGPFFPLWGLALPFVFLLIGILMAWFEYQLHERLFAAEFNQLGEIKDVGQDGQSDV